MKFTINKKQFTLFLASSVVAVGALSKGPGVGLNHKDVNRLTTGATAVHNQFAPKLHTDHGCEPFAAVDDQGNYNKGLKDSGSHNGNCSSSNTGQAYARSQCKDGFCGHMFVYYMPKDNGVPFPSLGHRHDFEEIVVWTKDGEFIGAAYSRHGDYSYHNNPHMSGGRVNPTYKIDGVTHSMGAIANNDKGKGTVWPVASWELMTSKARQALNDSSNFSNGVFAARDDNFIDKLNEARLSSVTTTFTK